MANQYHKLNINVNPVHHPAKDSPAPAPAPKKQPTPEPESEPAAPPPEPEIRFKSAQFEPHPVNGYSVNKACVITGLADFLKHTVCTRCTVKLFSIYNGAETNLGLNPATNGSTNINTTTGEFKFPEIILYIPQDYTDVEAFSSAIRYKAVIQSERCEKPLEIFLDLPDESVEPAPDLKLDMYDDHAVEKYKNQNPPKYLAGGEGYVKGTPVHEYQLTLERFRYLPSETANGVFGPKTDEATKNYQKDCLGKMRVLASGGKLINVTSISFKGTVDGVVGPKTRDEIALWRREDYLRPLPNLYHGDYDQQAVSNGIKRNTRGYKKDAQTQLDEQQDDYHDTGTPVVNAQKDLQKINAYGGALDGWFGDKMKESVGLFQDAAAKGEFVAADNTRVVLDKKLIDYNRGTLDISTHEYMKEVVEKDVKIEKPGKMVKKGDKGKIVEELNIRLSGFGGGVPSESFDDLTETKVKNFQRNYMKMKGPSGVVDEETVKAIDEFGDEYGIEAEEFAQMKCKCGTCSGFGKERYKGQYKTESQIEANHKYEYPGIHRMLLWGIGAMKFHLSQDQATSARFMDFSSGYRCHEHEETKKSGTTNHMGKAADIRFFSQKDGKWIRPTSAEERNKTVEAVRKLCTRASGLNAQYKWPNSNRFSMETTAQGAKTWVHLDVRALTQDFLSEKYFCKTHAEMQGLKMYDLWKEKAL